MAEGSHRISLEEALAMVARARQEGDLEVKGWRFDGASIREILDHPGVTGIRAYMAATPENTPTLVLVGTDDAGKDQADGPLAEYAEPCPPECDDASPFFDP